MSSIYLIQPSFAGGEISPYVANRVDLDKYKSALLNAENTVIRPYGGCYRRQGSQYIGQLKYDDKDAMLVAFAAGIDDAYLLEVGYQYIRIWKDDAYTGVELQTPFTDVSKLNFTQSADTMFICSGDYPIKRLSRTVSGWSFADYEITDPYFDPTTTSQTLANTFSTPGSYTYTAKVTGWHTVHIAGGGGGGGGGLGTMIKRRKAYKYTLTTASGGRGGMGELKTISVKLNAGHQYSVTVGSGGNGGKSIWQNDNNFPSVNITDGTAGAGSSFDGNTASGGGGGGKCTYTIDNNKLKTINSGPGGQGYSGGGLGGNGGVIENKVAINGERGRDGWVSISYDDNNTIAPSATSGENVTLTTLKDTFSTKLIGSQIRLTQRVPSQTVSVSLREETRTVEGEAIRVGGTWKLITHGTWKGEVTLQQSIDGVQWREYRKYTANDDQNYTESGTVTEPTWIRPIVYMDNNDDTDKSKITVDLTRLPYTHEGVGRITAVDSPTQAKVSVIKDFGTTDKTEEYAFSSWNEISGYPRLACFFQDRLVVAATQREPYSVWMSRTGDYGNFSVEKADGNVTDDSAVKLDLIARSGFEILHLIPSTDLVILTTGNEWIIPGDSVITPTKANPRPQTMRGSSQCLPQHIGNRIIYVQRSGATVRELGYQYDTDNYNGDDLTLLATHLTKNHKLLSSAYVQEPDSIMYFTRNDGVLLALTLIKEQNVYAWSHMTTDGKYKHIVSISSGNNDKLCAIVERTVNGTTKKYLEVFNPIQDDTDTYADCFTVGSGNMISVPHLIGKTVQIVVDGKRSEDKTVPESGIVELDDTYDKITAGLSYTTQIEQPGPDVPLREGTMQARISRISTVCLRVENSYGGYIGYTQTAMDEIQYDEWCVLQTGDIVQSMPNADIGSNTRNHIHIKHEEPFPFALNAIIREVSIDGGLVKSYNGTL